MSLTKLSNELKTALANRFPEGGVTSLENQEADTTIVASIEEWSPRARAILKQVTMGADGANMYLGHKAQSLAEKIAKLEEEIEEAKKVREAAKNAKPSNESIDEEVELSLEAHMSKEETKEFKKTFGSAGKAFWTKDGKLAFPSYKRLHDWLEQSQIDIDEKSAQVKALKEELKALKAESLKSSKESLDGGGLPTEPVKPKASEAAACADDKADAEGKTAPAVQSATPEHVSSQEGIEDGAAASAPVVDEAAVADPDGGEKIVQVAADHAPEESAEDALLAVHDASGAVDASLRESSELEDAAAGLESILASIAEYPQGLTPGEAKQVGLAIESIVGDWGLSQKICPSIESFGGTHLRREATASLEANAAEVLKSVYEYVVNLFKSFWNVLVTFYQRLTGAAQAASKRGEALAARVATIQVDAPTKTTVNIGSLAKRLTVNGQMPSLTNALLTVVMQDGVAIELEGHVQEIEQAVAQAVGQLRGLTNETFEAGFKDVATKYLAATKVPAAFTQNGEAFTTRVFPGEVYYIAEQKDGHWRFRSAKSGKETTSTTINTPSKGDLTSLGNRLKTEGAKAAANIDAIAKRIKADNGQLLLSQIQGPAQNLSDANARAIGKFVQQCAEDVKAIHALAKDMLTDGAKSMLSIVRVGEISCDLYKAPTAATPEAAEAAPGTAAPAAGGEAAPAPAAAAA